MAKRSRKVDAAAHAVPESGSLPAWFTTNRVHGHTRLGIRLWGDEPEFMNAATGFKLLGAHAFTRHVKQGDEDPWWPTGQPPQPNVVQAFIDDAHAQGMRIFGYYWHMSEKSQEGPHPDWVCRKLNGGTIRAAKRGIYLDMTGPYGELVVTRLRELAAMGVDGLFFDFRHLPPRGCWETALAAAWDVSTGAPPPVPNDADPVYQRFLDFKAARIEETFRYWRDQVKAEYPEVVFIVSTTTIPALTDREMTTRLARIADSSKNEYKHALNSNYVKGVFAEHSEVLRPPPDHVRQALGWTVLRDAADGRPPHIWATGVPDDNHARAYAASLLTFGCIANMDVHESGLGTTPEIPEWKTPLSALREAFALGADVSPHLAGTQPLRWAAVHFSERIRNDCGANFLRAWQAVLWPLVGAFQVLTRDGVPVGVVNDYQLLHGGLDGYRLLVLPNAGDLTHTEQLAVTAFRTSGGVVIENDRAWPWSEPDGGDAAEAAFRDAVRSHMSDAPVRVSGGPAGRYGMAYHRPDRLVVAVTNDFSWVQIRWTSDAIRDPAPALTGIRVTWRKDLLRGPRRFVRLRAIEGITGTRLPIEETARAYRVTLPRFQFMSLLVVTVVPTTLPRQRRARKTAGRTSARSRRRVPSRRA